MCAATNTTYAELEIGLHRAEHGYQVELRFTNPESDAEIPPEKGLAWIEPETLLGLQQDDKAYGDALTAQVFADEKINSLFKQVKAAVGASELFLRVRLLLGPSVPELQALRWELLSDPETTAPFATSEKTLFSRFMFSEDWRPVSLRPKTVLKALVAVAAPSDLSKYQLAAVDKVGLLERARASLRGIDEVVATGEAEPLTLEDFVARLREGVDIVYLVCHGVLKDGKPYLFLQSEDGTTAKVEGNDFALRLSELPQQPRLMVLASCDSAGAGEAGDFMVSLASRLANAGVPAVIAMQGKVSIETVEKAMPVFFAELFKDGQIDRAMAVARGAVRERADRWMLALYLRLKSGRIWYVPGFTDEESEFPKWKSICRRVRQGKFIPILGPDLGEHICGTQRELAERLAEAEEFPLATHERTELAKVAQYVSINQDRNHAQEAVLKQLREQVLERNRELPDAERFQPSELPKLLDVVVDRRREQGNDPYSILAGLRGSIYITASAETLLYKFLHAAGRKPTLLYCNWRTTEHNHPREPQYDNVPTYDQPVVYHVFGVFGQKDSLVLTEDDFFDYLIASATYKLIPTVVRGSLTESSLLFLGFSLNDWSFRVLFRLIMTLEGCADLKQYSHVAVQVDPEEHSLTDVKRARKYLKGYFGTDRRAGLGRGEPGIDIYWGSAADFLNMLRLQLEKTHDEEVHEVVEEEDGGDWF